MVPNENETYDKCNSIIFLPIILKNEFLMSSISVTCDYRNSGILRLSNWDFEFLN